MAVRPEDGVVGASFQAPRVVALQANQNTALQRTRAHHSDPAEGWVGTAIRIQRTDVFADAAAGAFVSIDV
jgi:hypothetical protein